MCADVVFVWMFFCVRILCLCVCGCFGEFVFHDGHLGDGMMFRTLVGAEWLFEWEGREEGSDRLRNAF